jgi:hypothetical protein
LKGPKRPREALQIGEQGAPYPPPPHFDEVLQEEISALQVRAVGAKLGKASWTSLAQILGEYYFWTSMVKEGDLDLLEKIAKRAKSLRSALANADRAGLSRIVAGALVAGKSGVNAKDVLVARLVALGSMAVATPFPHERQAELKLFRDLAEWWIRAGGKKTIRHDEEGPSHLVEFVKIALSAFPPRARPRYSAKTLGRRLREAQEQELGKRGKLSELAKKLRDIQSSRSSGQTGRVGPKRPG